jgi:ribonuclease HI
MSDNPTLEIIPSIPSISKKNTPPAILRHNIIKLIKEDYSSYFKLLTDGSKNNDGVGYGIYDYENKISLSYKLNSYFTITNAELVGIMEAIEYAITVGQFKIVIFTDSQSSCMSLINNSTENYLVQLIYTLIDINNFEKVIIQWIPGHTDTEGNDRADHAAKLGIYKSKPEHYLLTIGDALINFRNELTEQWNEEYNIISEQKGTKHFQIMNKIETKPWYHKIQMNTIQTITMGRIRSFHTATKDRLHKWNLITSPNCEFCTVEDSLFDCPGRNSIRKKYPVLSNKSGFIKVLKNKNIDEYVQMANFVKEAEINIWEDFLGN